MKVFVLIGLLLGLTITSHAQTCKIVITYDDNGNRINREKVCYSPRSPEEQDTDPDYSFKNKKQRSSDSTLNGITGTFNIYPNPANNTVQVYLDAVSLSQQCEIALLDQLGKEHFRITAINATTPVSIEHLPDGLYYIMIYRGNKKDVVKIVKESNAGNSR